MESLESRLTEKERAWVKEYFKSEGNATEATRRAYGGTPGACRVKGHKKLKKFAPILHEIEEREFHEMQYHGMSGIDFYLGDMERRFEKSERFWQEVGGAKGLIRLARGSR